MKSLVIDAMLTESRIILNNSTKLFVTFYFGERICNCFTINGYAYVWELFACYSAILGFWLIDIIEAAYSICNTFNY